MPIAAGQRGHERDRARGPAARRAGRGGSQHAVVHHPCDRDRGAGAAHRDGHARGDRDGPGRVAALAADRDREPAPEPRPDRRRAGRRPRRHHGPGPVRPDRAGVGVHTVQLAVPAAVAQPRHGGVRPAAGRAGDQPAPRPPQPPRLAGGAPAGLRLLAGRPLARARHRHRFPAAVGAGDRPGLHGRGGLGGLVAPVAGRQPGRARHRADRAGRAPRADRRLRDRRAAAPRAGTPPALLGRAPATAADGSGTSGGAGRAAVRLVNARFTGTVTVTAGPGEHRRTVTITGRTVVAPAERIAIVLHGAPSGGGVSLTDGTVRIGGAGAPAWSGPVVALAGADLVASVSGPGGRRQARFTLAISGRSVTGTVSLLTGGE